MNKDSMKKISINTQDLQVTITEECMTTPTTTLVIEGKTISTTTLVIEEDITKEIADIQSSTETQTTISMEITTTAIKITTQDQKNTGKITMLTEIKTTTNRREKRQKVRYQIRRSLVVF